MKDYKWVIYIVLYLLFSCLYSQFYQLATKKLIKAGTLTSLMQLVAGCSAIFFSLFFKFKVANDYKVYLLLFVSIIFYAISDRVNTDIRANVDTAVFSTLKQFSTIFLTIIGIFILKEPFNLLKIVGIILIIISNTLLFIKKGKLKLDKSVLLAIISNLAFAIAISLDANISKSFNLFFYIAITLIGPAICIILFEKIKLKDLKKEFSKGNKKAIIITGLCWGLSVASQLKAYQLGKLIIIAPLTSVVIILNAIIGYFFFKEKEDLMKKIFCGILIIISVILIGMK